jgi:hypothetical protein
MLFRSPAQTATALLPLVRRFAPYALRMPGRILQATALAALEPLVAAGLLWLTAQLVDQVFVAGSMDLLRMSRRWRRRS